MSKRQHRWLILLFSIGFVCAFTSPSFADNLVSPHYQFSESALGQDGLPNSSSASYSGSGSVGDIGVGYSLGTHYGFQGGSQTTNDPRLAVAITNPTATFPAFDPTTPSMTTATFQVLNYTSYGYNVFIVGNAPTNAGATHTIQPMATQGSSTAGFEQFGMNVVANTSPQNIGANPNNGTGAYTFAYGAAGDINHPANTNYNTTNQYVYNSGDLIASANKSGGYTNYTITYLVNVGHLTPGGQYTSNQSLVVVGTY